MNETIASLVTAPGGAVGIIRLSGDESLAIISQLFNPASKKFTNFKPYTLHRGQIRDRQAQVLDEALVVYMPGPNSFTGEDVVEIQAHGGTVLLMAILEELFALGARQALQGEFSKRAFLNGKIDLAQAEAIAEMIACPSKEGLHLASAKLGGALGEKVTELRAKLEEIRMLLCANLDFLDEDIDILSPAEFQGKLSQIAEEISKLCACYEGARHWQEGLIIVLAGCVNAGKSSLLNRILARPRAITSPIAGTTRDYLEEHSYIQALPVRLIDTAGLRDSLDPIENAGMEFSKTLASQADLVLFVIDSTLGLSQEDRELLKELEPKKCILVWNKSDLQNNLEAKQDFLANYKNVAISAKSGFGMDLLLQTIVAQVQPEAQNQGDILPNKRQSEILESVLEDLINLKQDITLAIPYDILAVSLEALAKKLGQITGLDATEDMINSIFENFCIGK